MAAIKIEEICDYFIVKVADAGKFVNLMKMHKLVYYSEAWWLAKKGESLAGVRFQAWVHGPVNPEIAERFRNLKKSFYLNMDRRDIQAGFDPASIPAEISEHLDRVLEVYLDFTGNQMEEIVCSERPWIAARGNTAPRQHCENTIDPAVMEEYYAGLLEQHSREIPAIDGDRFAG